MEKITKEEQKKEMARQLKETKEFFRARYSNPDRPFKEFPDPEETQDFFRRMSER